MIEFINLFFIPLIALLLHYRLRKWKLVPSLLCFTRYGIYAALTFLGAKLLSQVVNVFYALQLPPDRGAYTVFAVPVAIVLPYAIEFVQKYLHVEMLSDETSHKE